MQITQHSTTITIPFSLHDSNDYDVEMVTDHAGYLLKEELEDRGLAAVTGQFTYVPSFEPTKAHFMFTGNVYSEAEAMVDLDAFLFDVLSKGA